MSNHIEQLYIFEGFSQSEIAYFLLMSQSQTRKSGDVIIKQGDASNGCAYYLVSGHVKIIQADNEVALLGPGAFFGEIALITDELRTATVEAIDDIELQVFLKDDFLVLLKRSAHHEKLKAEILRRIKERVS
ncbi:cyclic nucleotide-binding domain-containing protein [Candidatus Gracilibacteria bacterium]|nr:cyclic nucleotide-binding domain-containing protein [Candidatus Gracilibacteria bacterium]